MIRWFLLCFQLFLPHWRQRMIPDRRHPFGRTLTKGYQARKSMVKNFWIASGMLMMAVPLLPVVVGLTLFTTFVSFMYLDEA
ncbi:MAG: hypothetical protein R3208_05855 [Ketobacteraceae bacterium]|nr:hypothetical protein [Ketobacteraceae bacterium]